MNPVNSDRTRPFAFEDLPWRNGKRVEPESWGPIYTKPPKPGKVRHVEPPTNAPSGQPYDFCEKKHRAKLRREFEAQANADRRAWAEGKPCTKACDGWTRSTVTETIHDAYRAAMAAKCERLAREALPIRFPVAA